MWAFSLFWPISLVLMTLNFFSKWMVFRFMSVLKPLYLLLWAREALSSPMQYLATCIFWLCVHQYYLLQITSTFIVNTMNRFMLRNWSLKCWQQWQMRAILMKLASLIFTFRFLFVLFIWFFDDFLFYLFSDWIVRVRCKCWYSYCKGIYQSCWENCTSAIWRKCHCW